MIAMKNVVDEIQRRLDNNEKVEIKDLEFTSEKIDTVINIFNNRFSKMLQIFIGVMIYLLFIVFIFGPPANEDGGIIMRFFFSILIGYFIFSGVVYLIRIKMWNNFKLKIQEFKKILEER